MYNTVVSFILTMHTLAYNNYYYMLSYLLLCNRSYDQTCVVNSSFMIELVCNCISHVPGLSLSFSHLFEYKIYAHEKVRKGERDEAITVSI